MSDVVWQAIIAAGVTIALAWMNRRTTAKLAGIAQVAEKTHTLVNSAFGVQLRLVAELSRWKADKTGLSADAKDAVAAEQAWKEHQEKQSKVDAGVKT